VAEPELNFHRDGTVGTFTGGDVTTAWSCPAWFPASVCSNVTQVVRGNIRFAFTDGSRFFTRQELVVADVAGAQVLYVHWVQFGFACPWYRTLDEALAANPFPVPFNGTDWPAADCAFAP
jgi:hypothetical protein